MTKRIPQSNNVNEGPNGLSKLLRLLTAQCTHIQEKGIAALCRSMRAIIKRK